MWRSDFKQVAALWSAEPIRGPAAVAPVFEWENPPNDLDVARSGGPELDAAELRYFRIVRTRYERMYREVGGVPVRPRVITFLNERGAPLIRSAYDDATGRELYRAVRGLVALAGVCAYDANLQGVAQRYFFQALRMAKRPVTGVRGLCRRAAGEPGFLPGLVPACGPVRRNRTSGCPAVADTCDRH